MPPDSIYLDHAAATPMSQDVMRAMQPFYADQFYNPSASYGPAKQVAEALLQARQSIAHWLGSRPSEVIFTAGGTEADNLAIHGIMQSYPGGNIVVSAIEHDAVLGPTGLYDARLAAVTADGSLNLDSLATCIDDKTVLISIMYANNEIGTIQPVRQVSKIVEQVRHQRRVAGNTRPLYLHSDACQASNYLDMHVARLGVDLLTINGGKMYGPKQSGALYVKAGLVLRPQVLGGGQEQGLRSGTENVAASIGLAAAFHAAQTSRSDESRRLQGLQQTFLTIIRQKIPQAIVNGSTRKRLPNNIHLTVPGHDNERLLLQLESKGILAAAGSACSASSDEPSHVLQAIGLSQQAARASLRFSMGRTSDQAAVERAVQALADCLES